MPVILYAKWDTIQYGNLLVAEANDQGIPIGTRLYPVRFVYPHASIVFYFFQNEFGDWNHPQPVLQGTFPLRNKTPQPQTSTGGLRSGVGDVYSQAGVRGAAPVPTPASSPTPATDDRLVGYNDGKYYGEHRDTDSWWKEHYGKDATLVQVREFAEKFSYREGEVDGPARDSYIEGFIDGYRDDAGIPKGK